MCEKWFRESSLMRSVIFPGAQRKTTVHIWRSYCCPNFSKSPHNISQLSCCEDFQAQPWHVSYNISIRIPVLNSLFQLKSAMNVVCALQLLVLIFQTSEVMQTSIKFVRLLFEKRLSQLLCWAKCLIYKITKMKHSSKLDVVHCVVIISHEQVLCNVHAYIFVSGVVIFFGTYSLWYLRVCSRLCFIPIIITAANFLIKCWNMQIDKFHPPPILFITFQPRHVSYNIAILPDSCVNV